MYLDPLTSFERVLYGVCTKRQEREVVKWCDVKDKCYIGVLTLKLIQWARTKELFISRNCWIAP